MNESFWEKLEKIVRESGTVVERPKGTFHPRYPSLQYPLDYGYLKNTSAGDGSEIDVWLGSGDRKSITYIVCTVDVLKSDAEVKLLLGCTGEEKDIVLGFHNNGGYMSAIAVSREGMVY